jgi:hypothetical protein
LGILNGNKFSDIWVSDAYQKFRRAVLEDRKQTSMCTNCTEGLKINILEIEQ